MNQVLSNSLSGLTIVLLIAILIVSILNLTKKCKTSTTEGYKHGVQHQGGPDPTKFDPDPAPLSHHGVQHQGGPDPTKFDPDPAPLSHHGVQHQGGQVPQHDDPDTTPNKKYKG